MKTNFRALSEVLVLLAVLATCQIARGEYLLTPNNIVANQYHAVQDGPGGDSRATALTVATDGIISTGNAGGGNINGFDTWPAQSFSGGSGTPGSDHAFAGLEYGTAVPISSVEAFMGGQFGDGGNWASMPNLYVLTTPLGTDPNSGMDPPDVDTAHWTLVSPSAYHATGAPNLGNDSAMPGPSTPYDYALNSPITAYGWALGGVASPASGSNFISISELRGFTTPEPSSLMLCGLGTLGLFVAARRRRAQLRLAADHVLSGSAHGAI